MATNTPGTDARLYHTSQTHYLRETVTGNTIPGVNHSLGFVPAGSIVVGGGIVVQTAFDGTTTIDIGTADDPDGFATDVALSSAGVKAADELATSNDVTPSVDTEVVYSLANTAEITTGIGFVYVQFMPDLG